MAALSPNSRDRFLLVRGTGNVDISLNSPNLR
jgi:hypothetical protein